MGLDTSLLNSKEGSIRLIWTLFPEHGRSH